LALLFVLHSTRKRAGFGWFDGVQTHWYLLYIRWFFIFFDLSFFWVFFWSYWGGVLLGFITTARIVPWTTLHCTHFIIRNWRNNFQFTASVYLPS
jgi:hypothetical protein